MPGPNKRQKVAVSPEPSNLFNPGRRVEELRVRLERILGIKVDTSWQILKSAECGFDKLSKCCLAAIVNNHISLDKYLPPDATANNKKEVLQREVCKVECLLCDGSVPFTFEACLSHEDSPGLDYEDGQESATVRCSQPDCENVGIYIQAMCKGEFHADSGKFCAHCEEDGCGAFKLGEHLGDYRNDHCDRCGEHWFRGFHEDCPCNCSGSADGSDDDGFEDFAIVFMNTMLRAQGFQG